MVVFGLTLSALYGLGMMLASLFLLWGREAFHMTNILIEPVYFASGLNFPVGRLGALGALAIATLPFAVGLDAMRQLVFSGEPYITGTPSPEVEALILRRDDRGVHAARPVDDQPHRAGGPRRGARCRSAGNERDHVRPRLPAAPTPAGLGQLDAARFDPARTEGAGLADTVRSLRTALLLGWRIESNWTDPTLFVIYTIAKPVASLLLLVVMIEIIGGAASTDVKTFVILGSALWATVIAGIPGPAWSVLDDRERYRMLKYIAVSPSRLIVTLVGRGGARLAAGAMGTSVALVFSVIFLGLRVDLAAVHWPYLVDRPDDRAGAGGRDRRPAGRDLPPDPPGELVLPGGDGRRDVPADRRRVPARVLPDILEVLGLLNPITWWVEGVRRATRARRADVDRRRGLAVDRCHRNFGAGRHHHPRCLVRDRGARYTRGDRDLPVERASRTGAGAARPDHRLVAASAAADPGRSEGAAMRIYEGSPRQDFEEVFRSIGAFLDSHGMRDILLVEVPDGFVVQGLVTAGAVEGRPGRSPSGRSARRP